MSEQLPFHVTQIERATFNKVLTERIVKFTDIVGSLTPLFNALKNNSIPLDTVQAIRLSETVWLYRFIDVQGNSVSDKYDIVDPVRAWVNQRFQSVVFLTHHAEQNLSLSFSDGLMIDVEPGHHIDCKV
jgi:hypothetical protein